MLTRGVGVPMGILTLYISQSMLGLCVWFSSKSQAPPNLVRRMGYYFYDTENGEKGKKRHRRPLSYPSLAVARDCGGGSPARAIEKWKVKMEVENRAAK